MLLCSLAGTDDGDLAEEGNTLSENNESTGVAEEAASPDRSSLIRRIAAIVVTVVMLASIVSIVVVFARAGVIPTRYFVIAIIADVVVGVGLAIWLLTTKSPGHLTRYIVSLVLSLMVIIANFVGVSVGSAYNSFMDDVQPSGETVMYDVVGLASGSHDLASLKGKDVLLDSTDPLYDDVVDELATLVQVNAKPAANQDAVLQAVLSGTNKGGVIQDSYFQIFQEADEDSYNQLVILKSFSIAAHETPYQYNTPSPSATPTPSESAGPDAPFIVYISGMDVAGPITTRSRSDVNILMVINPKQGKILLVNTPRDYYVQLSGKQGLRDKLTHSGVYGIDTSVGTMNDLYSINIDYYVRVNFTSLVTLVDVLGGVDVESQYAFDSQNVKGYHFDQGTNHLNGAAALAFSRERYSFAGGDRVRGQNQEAVIRAIIAKLSDPSVLPKYGQILSIMGNAMQTSMPAEVIDQQIQSQLTNNTHWSITSVSVDGTGASEYTFTYPSRKLYVMVPIQSTVDTAKAQITEFLKP